MYYGCGIENENTVHEIPETINERFQRIPENGGENEVRDRGPEVKRLQQNAESHRLFGFGEAKDVVDRAIWQMAYVVTVLVRHWISFKDFAMQGSRMRRDGKFPNK
ncbi:hypothetical protein NL676_010694 [Syzygium grande]|nr:hypothetical protein NL676_010694 [Syzygium grande]